jgi:hypothetical protein
MSLFFSYVEEMAGHRKNKAMVCSPKLEGVGGCGECGGGGGGLEWILSSSSSRDMSQLRLLSICGWQRAWLCGTDMTRWANVACPHSHCYHPKYSIVLPFTCFTSMGTRKFSPGLDPQF